MLLPVFLKDFQSKLSWSMLHAMNKSRTKSISSPFRYTHIWPTFENLALKVPSDSWYLFCCSDAWLFVVAIIWSWLSCPVSVLVSQMVIEEVSVLQTQLEIEKSCRENAEALATKVAQCFLVRHVMLMTICYFSWRAWWKMFIYWFVFSVLVVELWKQETEVPESVISALSGWTSAQHLWLHLPGGGIRPPRPEPWPLHPVPTAGQRSAHTGHL